MMIASQDLMTLLRHSSERARLEAEDERRTSEFYARQDKTTLADIVGGAFFCIICIAAFFLLIA